MKAIFFVFTYFAFITTSYSQIIISEGDITGTQSWSNLGYGISINSNGNRVVISTSFTSASNPNDIITYDLINDVWTNVIPKISGPTGYDLSVFGRHIELNPDGNKLLFSSFRTSEYPNYYLYELINDNWSLVSEKELNGRGTSLTMNANATIIGIGMPGGGNRTITSYDENLIPSYQYISQSIVRLFDNSGNMTHTFLGDLYEYENTYGDTDDFGRCVKINKNGDRLFIGIPEKDINSIENVGQINIYEKDGIDWVLSTNLLGTSKNDYFGHSFCINYDGDRLFNVGFRKGTNTIYKLIDNDWSKLGNDIVADSTGHWDVFPNAMNGKGNMVIMGYASLNSAEIYKFNDSSWTLVGDELTKPSEDIIGAYNTGFGRSVALSYDGSRVLITDPEYNSAQGKIYYYSLSGLFFDLIISSSEGGTVDLASGSYDAGSEISISVLPDNNWLFTGWSGDYSSDYASSNITFTLSSNMSINANFSDDADDDGLLNYIEDAIGANPRYSESLIDLYNIVSNRVTLSEAQETMKDLRVGSQTFGVSNGNAKIRMYVDESSDLTSTWSNTQHILELDIPADADTKFYRFRID